ncbi:hypothetical protein FRC11_004774 [Ceratobasidium sp. 423]|nr:hypothetical protein FRC11_004774 [Ceratobasidium sp. 423]
MGLLEGLDTWPNLIHENTFGGPHLTSPVDQRRVPPPNLAILPFPPTGGSTSMTSGQVSLLSALFSLGNDLGLPISSANVALPANATTLSIPSGPTWSSPDAQEDDSSSDGEDLEGVSQIICQPLVLDKNVESNALPFVLQNYATWVARMAYEPLKVAGLARDFVVKQFEDGQESRWTLILLPNIGGRLGRGAMIDEAHLTMVLTLQTQVRRRLANFKTIGDDEIARQESVKALDATLETIIIHYYASPIRDWMTLRQEAATIFRQLCPEPPGSPINLPSLLQQPNVSLRHYAHMDIICSTLMDIPMLFRYDCTPHVQNSQPMCEPAGGDQIDSGAQWLHGTPDRVVAMFAKVNAMREDGREPTPEIVAVFERGIREFEPTQSNSRDSFLSLTRLVVLESWRQAAYVYLYMGLCGDSSDTPRVKQALKNFIKLLNGIKPGHMPDEFLVMNFLLIAPAAQKKRDREIMRERLRRLRVSGPGHGVNGPMDIVENDWAQADAEARPIMWSDIGRARMRVVGI